MEEKITKDSFFKGEFIKGLKDLNSSTLRNEEIELLRKKVNEEIRTANVKSLDDIFGEKHKEFLSDIRILSVPDIPIVNTWIDIQEHDEEIAGRKVLGKIRISDNEIIKWVDPDMLEKGVIFSDLLTAIKDHSKKVNQAFKNKGIRRNTFISNLIIGQSKLGSFLFIPDKIQPEGIFLIEIEVSHAHSLIPMHLITMIGKSAYSNLVIDIKSENNNKGRSILAIQNDLILADNSHLSIFQKQKTGEKTALFFSEQILEKKDANVNSFILDQGSAITDRFLAAELIGDGGSVNITALYYPRNGQRFYYDTHQNHSASYTKSDLLFKGVLGKNAYSSWKGNILISEDTRGTNGYQSNKSLILDSSAKAESIPGLEIITDDVRCSHGVTMGNIDKNQMFYLQSRGINEEDAEKLIVDGFLSSAVKRMADKDFEEFILNSFKN
jgi:Fe-S cluster assembly protein SufD